MTTISFRRAGEEDQDFIKELSTAVFSIYGDYDLILPRWFLSPWVVTIIASDLGEPVGFAMLHFGGKEIWEPTLGELLAIAVKPEHQGKGVGSAIINHVEELARESHLEKIQLHTSTDNSSARHLFQKAGYLEKESKESYYPNGQTAVLMVKNLDVERARP